MKTATPSPVRKPSPASKTSGGRATASEAALQMIYALELGGQDPEQIERWYIQANPLTPAARTRASRLLLAVATQREEIERLISAHAKGWRLERMSVVDRSLLKLAVAQVLADPALATGSINECLKLAKKFSQPTAMGFLHAVLDAVADEVGQRA